MQDGAILVLERVRKDFGGLRAVDDCSFVVETGKIVGLIGPNGAGKTTLFQVISGVLKRDSGHIYFHGDDISRLRPYEIARRGIGRTFQITRLPLKDHYAAELSFGQQKLLDLMRVMMLDPQLILLDEPAAGINPTMQNKILDLIHHLNDQGSTFLIIEHDMDIIMGHCEKVIALNFGRVIAEGRPDEVRENEEVLTAYFGK
jgi:ABC-type branched-subunit amino acid transport system ATPase component